jgi:hypothetical protein
MRGTPIPTATAAILASLFGQVAPVPGCCLVSVPSIGAALDVLVWERSETYIRPVYVVVGKDDFEPPAEGVAEDGAVPAEGDGVTNSAVSVETADGIDVDRTRLTFPGLMVTTVPLFVLHSSSSGVPHQKHCDEWGPFIHGTIIADTDDTTGQRVRRRRLLRSEQNHTIVTNCQALG